MELLIFIVIGAIAGWLAGQFMKGHGFGLLGDVVVGIVGSFVGGHLFRNVGAEIGGGWIGSIIIAFLGALVLLFVIRLIKGRHVGRRV